MSDPVPFLPRRPFSPLAVDHARYVVINAVTDLQVQAQLADTLEELGHVRAVVRQLETLITAATTFVGALQDQRSAG